MKPDEQVTILYIAGDGRSGSTLLERTLGQLSSFVAVGETKHIWQRSFIENQLCGCGQPFYDCSFWQEVRARAYGDLDLVPEEARALQRQVDRIRNIPQLRLAPARTAFSRRCVQYADLLVRLYRASLEVSGASVVVDSSKDIATLYLLSRVPQIDLYVLHLVRDSRGVAYSWSKKKERPEITDRTVYMPQYPPQKAAWIWLYRNLFIEAAFARRDSRYRFVRYEEFVTDPRETVRSIVGFVGAEEETLPFVDDDVLDLGIHNHTVAGNPMRFRKGELKIRQDNGWRRDMKRLDRLIVTGATLPLLQHYGYAP